MPNFRRHLSSAFLLIHYRMERNLFVKFHLDLRCLQKPIIIACGSERVEPVLFARSLTLTSDAAPNYKHMFRLHPGPLFHLWNITVNHIQSNLNSSNTDDSFTMAYSVLSPYEILPIDQENKYLRKLSYFIMKLYAVCTFNIQLLCRRSTDFPELAIWRHD